MSMAPSVSRQISGPVVRSWMAGLAGFSNWRGPQWVSGFSLSSSSALAMAPGMPLAPSVSTISAPRAFISFRRSRLMLLGMVSTHW